MPRSVGDTINFDNFNVQVMMESKLPLHDDEYENNVKAST